MKKLTAVFTLIFTLVFSLTGSANFWGKTVRGNGNVSKELRKVTSFNGIKASAGINVYLFQGNEEKVIVEADENIQECVKTEVEGGVLKCYIDCSIRHSTKLNVYVNFKNINLIKASSGAEVFGETIIETKELKINVSSGADVKIEVNAGEVDCNVSSGSDAVIEGTADEFYGDASSGADIKAEGLEVKYCKASASSAGDIKITVTETIEASASSGADVIYYGNPKNMHVHESSGGDVKRR